MTWNWIVGSIAVSSVIVIVTNSIGLICILGWKLGIIEAIVLIVIVGVSVDYSVHISHAYNHAFEKEGKTRAELRIDKAYHAVGSMGISLLSGMITSIGSAIFL